MSLLAAKSVDICQRPLRGPEDLKHQAASAWRRKRNEAWCFSHVNSNRAFTFQFIPGQACRALLCRPRIEPRRGPPGSDLLHRRAAKGYGHRHLRLQCLPGHLPKPLQPPRGPARQQAEVGSSRSCADW